MKKKIQALRDKGFTIREIMKKVGLKSTSAVVHYLKLTNPTTNCIRCGGKLSGWAGPQEWIQYCCDNPKCNRYRLVVLI